MTKYSKPNTSKSLHAATGHPGRWKAKGIHEAHQGNFEEARPLLLQALAQSPDDPETLTCLGYVELNLGKPQEALRMLQQAVERDGRSAESRYQLARTLHSLGENESALREVEVGLALSPGNEPLLEYKGLILKELFRYDEAIETFEGLIKRDPNSYSHWNNTANLYRNMCEFEKAENCYRKAIQLSGNIASPFSNYLTCLHYNPLSSREEIFSNCKEWESRYALHQAPERPKPCNLSPSRRLRLGMFSDGFRMHPVGQMITAALENLERQEFEIFAYSTNATEDFLTQRIKRTVDHWVPVQHLSEEDFAQRIRDDQIDIFIDLNGHNSGTRMRTMAMQPAPLLVKWVGGLINTMGLSSIDYLITDTVESPAGEDEFYTEKLIRMPDDYICYTPPPYIPNIAPLPASKNGHLTLGCFNNPSKINDSVLAEWAILMRELPNSRLLLKGHQYNSDRLRQKVRDTMASHGIGEDRLDIEGYSPHTELLETYNRIDIALDPWPYSGGLTTCEAFMMGVPVVSLPGPTFAGRHSATHLVNAGMPELVTNSWDRYRTRVLELASDLDSLSTIRRHLREVLLQSPVCDGPRFAKNFTVAMRAIWQRYCEGKQPAALTLDKEGQAWFEGDSKSMQLQHPEPELRAREDDFRFTFEGKVITLDHGGSLVGTEGFASLQRLGAFATIAFDPASKVNNVISPQSEGELHLYPHIALGDGQETTLYACLDPAMNATLEPLSAERQLPNNRQGTQVIAQLPIATLRLDDIEGLESIDWLLLDNLNDSLKILENGEKALVNTLLVQARVNFVPTHEHQPELTLISHWLSRHGFSFYRLNNLQHYSHLPRRDDLAKSQATQLTYADALFVPNEKRMAELTDNQRLKLAFVLHTVYGIQDLATALISDVSLQKSLSYLMTEGFLLTSKKLEMIDQERQSNIVDNSLSLPEAPFMSDAERELFKEAIEGAEHYFEFGSGGSTVWAVREGLAVKGVESDAKWVNALKSKLGKHCQVEAVDIGPTGEWGYPLSQTYSDKFPDYSRAIHKHQTPFDLILVDGRFRVACVISAIQHALGHQKDLQKARIFIHDFWNRPQYHVVLDFLDTVGRVDSAGLFKIKEGVDCMALESLWKEYAKQPA